MGRSTSKRCSSTLPQPVGAASPPSGLSGPALRLLRALADDGATTARDPAREDRIMVLAPRSGISLGRGHHGVAGLAELTARDLVERLPGAGRDRHAISSAGRAHLRRVEAAASEAPYAAQHRELRRAQAPDERGDRVVVNLNESPLDWLRRRRDRDGEPLIDAASYEAGERLRRDLTVAGMLPSVTARWDGAIGTGAGAPRDPAAAADATIAARQRVSSAMREVGGDFANLLLDLCGFLKGLEQIERERSWPPRSGKVVVRLALRHLARHYGYEAEASGPATSRGLRSWSEEAVP